MVCSITPVAGLTSNIPPKGGEFVMMTTLLEEEYPLPREQVRVKTNDDCWGRLFPMITKLNTCGELGKEGGKDRERGDRETDDKTIESSSTDHCTSPLDPMSTLPKIFSFEEGFIFNPDSASNFTTGDWEARMVISMAFSQLLVEGTPGNFEDFPLITTWNTAPTSAEEELAVTVMTGEAENDEKMRETQESRYEGEVWKHLSSKVRGWGLELGSTLES
jgi:hypothetical protein